MTVPFIPNKGERSKGQVLIEAIVAMGILSIAVFSIFQFLARSTSLNRQVSQEYTATYLAAEGLEVVKNILDSTWLAGCGAYAWNYNAQNHSDYSGEVDYQSTYVRSASGKVLKQDPLTGFYQYSTGDDTPFKRVLDIRTIELDKEIRVKSKVTWKIRGGGENTVELEDHFYRWQPLPISCFP